MWLELCAIMIRELPQVPQQAMRIFERFSHKPGYSRAWYQIHDALRPIMESDIQTHLMFGLAPFGNCIEFAVQMSWRFRTAFPDLPEAPDEA